MNTSKASELENISLRVTSTIRRVLDELTHNQRAFNRSLIVRQAILEKADRELPAGWREALGVDDEGEAA